VKKLVCLLVALFFSFLCGCAAEDEPIVVKINGNPCEVAGYGETEAAFLRLLETAGDENIRVYDASELTAEILENRSGTMIVERCIGLVTSKQRGDGIVLNAANEDYNYISYRGVYRPISDGTVMLSYMVYNPDNNYVDDIMERYDFVLSREWED